MMVWVNRWQCMTAIATAGDRWMKDEVATLYAKDAIRMFEQYALAGGFSFVGDIAVQRVGKIAVAVPE